MKTKPKSIDNRESLKVVTNNDFITAVGPEKLSLKARKLLYIAISQVRKNDKEFYEFRITPIEFATMMDVDVSNIYDKARDICQELRPLGIKCRLGEKKERVYSAFSYVEYSDSSDIVFKLNSDMTDFLLELNKSFTQPLLHDFLHMKSPYSMAIWHLCQREMKSKKPKTTGQIEFDLSLEELRQVTGTEDKLKQLVHFKTKVLDKALREILENCGVRINYTNNKNGKTVVGFHFVAENWFHIDLDQFDPIWLENVKEKAKALQEKANSFS